MDQKLRILRRRAYAENASRTDMERYILALEQQLNINRQVPVAYPPQSFGALIDKLLGLSETALRSDLTVEDGTNNECYLAELRIADVEHGVLDEDHPIIYFNEDHIIENEDDLPDEGEDG